MLWLFVLYIVLKVVILEVFKWYVIYKFFLKKINNIYGNYILCLVVCFGVKKVVLLKVVNFKVEEV